MGKYSKLAALLLSCAAFLSAQTITGSITGTATDPSGAIVANVKITATNVGTGVTYNANTNEAGVYNIPFLPIGQYTVAAEQKGFKTVKLGPFALEVNQIARVDVKLEVGEMTQTVEITAVAPILQTESTATGASLTADTVSSIPLNGRNFASLTQLIPGAISTSPNAMNTSGRVQGSGSRPQVNGNREQTNNFLLDGVDNNDSIDNRIGYQPNVDALEEVKVITGNGSSEFGNVGGAIVNATLKSGTNQYHGNVFEFLRNAKLDANGYFANRSRTPRNPFKRNIFGGTFGGPVMKNKLFFFVDYEQTEQRNSGAATASVLPASWRTGDLGDFLRLSNQVVKDPTTGNPFPGNIIPTNRIVNPVALKLFSSPDLYPLPNNPGTGALGVGSNYLGTSASKLSNKQGDIKGDWRFSDKDSLMMRWSISEYESLGSQAALPVILTSGNFAPTQSAVLSWTRTFTPTIINEARIGYTRVHIDEGLPIDWSGLLGADGNAKFGIGGGQPVAGLSGITIGTVSGIGTGAAIGREVDNKITYSDNLTWQKGAHFVRMGGQAIRYRQNRYYAGNNGALGTFTYDGSVTGIVYGDFLLNQLIAKGRGAVVGKWGHRHWRAAPFIQDDWKVSRTLTVNLGMRWEYTQPIYEVADRQVNITPTGQLLYAGQNGNSRALYNPYYKAFEPRVGFAWNPTSRFVLRGGYAISTFLEGTGANLRLPLNPPFFFEANVNYDIRTPGDIRVGFADTPATGVLNGPRTGVGGTPYYQGRAWEINLRPQFTQQFNLTTEYQFSKSTSLTVAYVGQVGTHLVDPHEMNNPLPGVGPVASWAPSNDRRPLATVLPNVGNIALTESAATMSYNALQVSGRHRTSGGLTLTGFFVWSKSIMDNLGYYGCAGVASDGAYWQDAYNRKANNGPACFDAKLNGSLGGAYQLPFGRNRAFGKNWAKPLDLIAGGWELDGFMNMHSGFPVSVNAGAANTGGRTPRGNVRANYYRPFTITGTQTVDQFFGPVNNAAAFCTAGVDNGTCSFGIPAAGELGNSGVGVLRAPSFFNMDMSISKKFYITEQKYITFRSEFFNALNHVSWGSPGRDITSPASFGAITGQVQNARNIQFGLKFNF